MTEKLESNTRLDDEKVREFYRLWIEYLKQSEHYKIFCEWFKKYRIDPDNNPLPSSLNNEIGANCAQYHSQFHDIYEYSFQEIWDELIKPDLEFRYKHRNKNIFNYADIMEKNLDSDIDWFTREHGREPTAQELKKIAVSRIKNLQAGQLCLYFSFASSNNEEIISEFKKILKESKASDDFKNTQKWTARFFKPMPTKISFDELRLYLEVYKRAQKRECAGGEPGYHMSHIIADMFPDTDPEDAKGDPPRIFHRYLQKAKEIIKNVERGYFPLLVK